VSSGRFGWCLCLSRDLGVEKCYPQLFCDQCATDSQLQLPDGIASDWSLHDFAWWPGHRPRAQWLEKMLPDPEHQMATFHLLTLAI